MFFLKKKKNPSYQTCRKFGWWSHVCVGFDVWPNLTPSPVCDKTSSHHREQIWNVWFDPQNVKEQSTAWILTCFHREILHIKAWNWLSMESLTQGLKRQSLTRSHCDTTLENKHVDGLSDIHMTHTFQVIPKKQNRITLSTYVACFHTSLCLR